MKRYIYIISIVLVVVWASVGIVEGLKGIGNGICTLDIRDYNRTKDYVPQTMREFEIKAMRQESYNACMKEATK